MSSDGDLFEPAFPTTKPLDGWGDPNRGMSLRDYFAGQALPALLGELLRPSERTQADGANSEPPRNDIARRAYAMADAMLVARNT